MAPSTARRFRFTVPLDDTIVSTWASHQINLSLSLRVLVQHYVEAYGSGDIFATPANTARSISIGARNPGSVIIPAVTPGDHPRATAQIDPAHQDTQSADAADVSPDPAPPTVDSDDSTSTVDTTPSSAQESTQAVQNDSASSDSVSEADARVRAMQSLLNT